MMNPADTTPVFWGDPLANGRVYSNRGKVASHSRPQEWKPQFPHALLFSTAIPPSFKLAKGSADTNTFPRGVSPLPCSTPGIIKNDKEEEGKRKRRRVVERR